MNHFEGKCEKCQHKICTKRVPIFKELSEEELSKVVNLITRRRYTRGELVLMEDNLLDSLMIINEGKVKAFRYTKEGKEQILYIFSQGDFFGEKNLLKQQVASYNIEALEETHICMINKKDFQQLLRDHPEISFKIIEELCVRNDHLEHAIQNMGTKNMEARVNSVLLEFLKKYGKDHPKGVLIELPLSREGIANYIGVARETVSRKLSHLQSEGVIELIGNKKVLILDTEALEIDME